MVLEGEINASKLLRVSPTRKASCGQRKANIYLSKDKRDHQFSVDSLVRQYLKQSMSPFHWHVMRDFDVKTEQGEPKRDGFCGTIVSWGDNNNNGVFYWSVEYLNSRRPNDYYAKNWQSAPVERTFMV
ncbi:hypothetical protein GN244_ATG13467 [Phytophthora infestans]|uniref:Uncharacterized protein n=1 Tax=Phytophthora infestans TaxID=4787 RepID=A0A833S6M2_PHYIN|nr:hypothetical protein GN244_ATG13467 [Phytophthora infestans]KAF4136393.1 hypothetical protein GN958_ATG14407 [Phytophthora infestans]KAF4137442.1 hypothetical protein GN958_ATG13369 [Phytophthora infestans]KAF4143399.1 hypothetical protein GN958_ATG07408 [Phytophthora infestans]